MKETELSWSLTFSVFSLSLLSPEMNVNWHHGLLWLPYWPLTNRQGTGSRPPQGIGYYQHAYTHQCKITTTASDDTAIFFLPQLSVVTESHTSSATRMPNQNNRGQGIRGQCNFFTVAIAVSCLQDQS